MASLSRLLADFLWPSPGKNYLRRQKEENDIFEKEIEELSNSHKRIDFFSDTWNRNGKAAQGKKEKQSHKINYDIILHIAILAFLFAAGCVLFFIGKAHLDTPMTRFFFIFACIYLPLQWIAALRAIIKGLTAKAFLTYRNDWTIYPQNKINSFLNEKDETLFDISLLHEINQIKLDNLTVASRAINNYLWAMLFFTIMFIISMMIPASTSPSIVANEIIQSQKQITSTPTTDGNVADGLRMTLFIALAATFAMLGAALFLLGKTWRQKIVGGIMFVSGSILGLGGKIKFDTTLFALDNLVGEIQVKLTKIENTVDNPRPYYTFIRKVVTVGPFPDGGHLLDAHSTVECVRNALVRYDKIQVGGWEVIGRVDKRQLKPQPMGIYGSNQALAMARASWVVQKILTPQATFNVEHAVISVGGAQGIGTSVGVNDMQSDRAVDVFAMVNSHNDKDALAALPKPVICP
ncbi:hypothetical protein [Janthinobacterium rivuli]|uniref:hypothetical protein n=1 Tax=Janthinobacterium rivuli TaxID=2751478 RepID=UPI00383BF4BB